jgi:hypothetical protein
MPLDGVFGFSTCDLANQAEKHNLSNYKAPYLFLCAAQLAIGLESTGHVTGTHARTREGGAPVLVCLEDFCRCRVQSKRGRIRRVKYWEAILAISTALSVSIALADDFKTIDGKEYKNATVSRVEPDGLVLRTKSGISKVYFTELPQDVQERFHYNTQQAAQFTNQTIEEVRLAQQQKIEADKKRAEEIAKNLEQVRQQQEAEIQRQHEAEMQRQRLESEQHHQVQTNTQPTYSRSQEGIPEHTYELTQELQNRFWRCNDPFQTRRAVSRTDSS